MVTPEQDIWLMLLLVPEQGILFGFFNSRTGFKTSVTHTHLIKDESPWGKPRGHKVEHVLGPNLILTIY